MALTFTTLTNGQVQVDTDAGSSNIGWIISPATQIKYDATYVSLYDRGSVVGGDTSIIRFLPEDVPAAGSSDPKIVAEYLADNFFSA